MGNGSTYFTTVGFVFLPIVHLFIFALYNVLVLFVVFTELARSVKAAILSALNR